jgi:hypothetical protein
VELSRKGQCSRLSFNLLRLMIAACMRHRDGKQGLMAGRLILRLFFFPRTRWRSLSVRLGTPVRLIRQFTNGFQSIATCGRCSITLIKTRLFSGSTGYLPVRVEAEFRCVGTVLRTSAYITNAEQACEFSPHLFLFFLLPTQQ